jgi:rhamnosyltransferase subunit B
VKVLVISGIGSIGDVYPFMGLGVALKARGHHVTIMASGRFREDTAQAGLEFVQLGPSDEMMLNYFKPKWVREEAMPLVLNDVYRLIEEHHEPGQTVVVAALGTIGAAVAGDKLGVPVVYASVSPAYFQKHLDPFLRRTGPVYGMLYEAAYHPRTAPDALRAELGLPPKTFSEWLDWCRSPGPVLGLFPDWYAPLQARWLTKVSLTEFSLYDAADKWAPSGELVKFLEQGEPPVVFARSSWSRLPERAITQGAAACGLLGHRGIFVNLREHERSQQVPPEVGLFGYVPFSWILPRSVAVVHQRRDGNRLTGARCRRAPAGDSVGLRAPVRFGNSAPAGSRTGLPSVASPGIRAGRRAGRTARICRGGCELPAVRGADGRAKRDGKSL